MILDREKSDNGHLTKRMEYGLWARQQYCFTVLRFVTECPRSEEIHSTIFRYLQHRFRWSRKTPERE